MDVCHQEINVSLLRINFNSYFLLHLITSLCHCIFYLSYFILVYLFFFVFVLFVTGVSIYSFFCITFVVFLFLYSYNTWISQRFLAQEFPSGFFVESKMMKV